MNLITRVKAPSPKFFKVLRNIGLALAAVGGTLLASPIALPVLLTSVGGYLAVAGGVISAVSQLTTAEEGLRQAQPDIDQQSQPGVSQLEPDPVPQSQDVVLPPVESGPVSEAQLELAEDE